MLNKLSLEEFIQRKIVELNKFEEYWEEKIRGDPPDETPFSRVSYEEWEDRLREEQPYFREFLKRKS